MTGRRNAFVAGSASSRRQGHGVPRRGRGTCAGRRSHAPQLWSDSAAKQSHECLRRSRTASEEHPCRQRLIARGGARLVDELSVVSIDLDRNNVRRGERLEAYVAPILGGKDRV